MRKERFFIFCIVLTILSIFSLSTIGFAEDTIVTGVCKTLSSAVCVDSTSAQCGADNVDVFFYSGQSLANSTFRNEVCLPKCCCYKADGSDSNSPFTSRIVYGDSQYCSTTLSGTVYDLTYSSSDNTMQTSCSNTCANPVIGGGTNTGSGNGETTGNNQEVDQGTIDDTPIIDCSGSATIYGTVSVSSNYALPSNLFIHASKAGCGDRSVIVKDDGTYRITGLANGSTLVSLEHTDISSWIYTPATVDLTTYDNRQVDFTITPQNIRTIRGVVTNEVGDVRLANAIVRVDGTSYVASTNAQGAYTLTIITQATSFTLTTSASNYKTKSEAISFNGATTTKDIQLESDACDSIPTKLASFVVENVKGKSELKLTWQTSQCEDLIQSFDIYRCIGSNLTECKTSGLVGYAQVTDPTARTFTDTQTAWARNYTYAVEVQYSNGLKSQNGNVTRDTGDAVCENIFDNYNYCSSTNPAKILNCNANNKQTNQVCNAPNTLCQVFYDQNVRSAECRSPAICYSSQNDNIFGLYDDEQVCRSFKNSYNDPVCYYDKLNTVVDSCISCRVGMSCSSYKTQNACEDNYCGVSAAYSGCQWEPIGSDENTGTGICVEKKAVTCESCANGPFGICDKSTCNTLSTVRIGQTGLSQSACMFNGATCNSCEKTTCYDYTSQVTCEGGASGSRSLNLYTNVISNPSLDQCGVSACAWVNNACVKDADDSGLDDCSEVRFSSNVATDVQLVQCRSDKSPAVTYVDLPLKVDVFSKSQNLLFLSLDSGRTGKPQVNQTRYCVMNAVGESIVGDCSNTNNFVLAQLQYDGFFKGTLSQELDWIDGEQYTLRYFSIDYALNREIVKEKNFTAQLALVNITNITVESVSNAAQKNILVTVDVSEPAACTVQYPYTITSQATLYDPASTDQTFATRHQKIFSVQNNGNKFVKVTCRNSDGAYAVELRSVLTEGRIFNVAPSVSTTESVTLTHETYEPAQCAYSNTPFNSLAQGEGQYARTLVGNVYKYSKTLNFNEGLHNLYIVCDFNGKSESFDHVFAVDPNPSTLQYVASGSKQALTAGWYQPFALQAICDGGISSAFSECKTLSYCMNAYAFGGAVDQSCTPSKTLSFIENVATFSEQLNSSKVICGIAAESDVTNNRETDLTCLQLYIDANAPNISGVTIAPSVANNIISVSGTVTDPTYYYPTATLSATAQFIPVATSQAIRNVLIQGNFTRQQTATTTDIIIRGTSSDGIGVRIESDKIRVVSFSSSSVTTIAQEDMLVSATVPYFFTINVTENTFAFTFDQKTITTTVSKNTAGPITFKSNGAVSLKEVSITDLNIQQPLRLFANINGNEQQLAELSSTGTFAVQTQLTQEVSIANGRRFKVEIYAKDIVNHTSNKVSQLVTYDVEGPYVTNLVIFPTNTQQLDKSYIEYTEDADATVTASDISGLKSANITVQGITKTLSTTSASTIKGTFSTIGMPAGKNDVVLQTFDVFGNIQSDVYLDFLTIRNTKNPLTQINTSDDVYTSDSTAQITISTLGHACTATYTDANGNTQVAYFTDDAQTAPTQTATLTNLPATFGEEERTKVLIACTSTTGDTFTQVVTIHTDKRAPVVAITISPSDDSQFTFTDRDTKAYALFKYVSSRILFITSDEEVTCSLPELNIQTSVYQKSHLITRTPSDGQTIDTTMLCEDRAGNFAVTKHIVVSLDSTADPVILDSGVTYNEGVATLFATTARPMTCTADSQIMTRNTVDTHYEYTLHYNPTKAQGTYDYTILCTLNSKSASASGSVVYDTTAPQISLTQTSAVQITSSSVAQITGTTSESVTVSIYNKGLRNIQTVASGDFTLSVPVDKGMNDVTFVFADGAKNTVTLSQFVFRGDGNSITSTPYLASYSANVNELRVSYPSSSATATLTLTSQTATQQQVITGIYRSSTQTYNFDVSSLASGTYVGKLELDSFVDYVTFTKDTYSEIVSISDPSQIKSTTQITNITVQIPYINLISNTQLLQDDVVKTPVSQYGNITKKVLLSEGLTTVQFSSQNDLEKDILASKYVIYDAQTPRAQISIYPNGGSRALVPKPSFQVIFDQPSKIADAYIRLADGTKKSQVNAQSTGFVQSTVLDTQVALSDGSYEFVLVTEDEWGQGSRDEQIFAFTIKNTPFGIQVLSPQFGLSSTPQVNVTLATAYRAICGYAQKSTVQNQNSLEGFTILSGDNYTHSGFITINQQLVPVEYVFRCNAGVTASTTMSLTYDPRAPTLDLSLTNTAGSVVISKDGTTQVIAKTDIASRCRISPTQTPFTSMQEFSVYDAISTSNSQQLYGLVNGEAYTYYVQCESGAGVLSPVKSISFTVDSSRGNLIQIINPSPGAAYVDKMQALQVKTLAPVSDRCWYGSNENQITQQFTQISADKTSYNATAKEYVQGKNTIFVRCIFNAINGDSYIEETSTTFMIDSTPPQAISIDAPAAVDKNQISAEWEFFDNESDIDFYEYSIGTAPYGSSGWNNTIASQTTRNDEANWVLNLVNNTKYYWSVRAVNRAGLNSSYLTSNGTLVLIQTIVPLINNTPYQPTNASDCRLTNNCTISEPVFAGNNTQDTGKPERQVRDPIEPETEGSNLRNALLGGSLIFILALGLIGSALGYTVYQKHQSRNAKVQAVNTSEYEPTIGTRPVTVQDKLKLALQDQLKKQKEKEHSAKAFSAFEKPESSSSSPLLKNTESAPTIAKPKTALDTLKSKTAPQKRSESSVSKLKKLSSSNSVDKLKRITRKKK